MVSYVSGIYFNTEQYRDIADCTRHGSRQQNDFCRNFLTQLTSYHTLQYGTNLLPYNSRRVPSLLKSRSTTSTINFIFYLVRYCYIRSRIAGNNNLDLTDSQLHHRLGCDKLRSTNYVRRRLLILLVTTDLTLPNHNQPRKKNTKQQPWATTKTKATTTT